MKLSKDIIQFFLWELLNEDNEGISPSTLSSAIDSYRQAPDDILRTCTVTGIKEPKMIGIDLGKLTQCYGDKTRLMTLMDLANQNVTKLIQTERKLLAKGGKKK